MNSAVLFIGNQRELDLAFTELNDKNVVDYTIDQIRRLDVSDIYLVGASDLNLDGVIKRDTLEETILEVKKLEGTCLLVSPFYPLLDKNIYKKLLDNSPCVLTCKEEFLPFFSFDCKDIDKMEELSYSNVELDFLPKKFDSLKDIGEFNRIIRESINNKWLDKGVVITDPNTVFIGSDVSIDKNTVIKANVSIRGKSVIGKNNVIEEGSFISNSNIGDNNRVYDSKIIDSVIKNKAAIGPDALVVDSEVNDESLIGSYTKLKSSKIGKNVYIEHLSFIGDCMVGDNVKIGAGVVTVNNDSRSRNMTIIKSFSTIGSNVSLIAPLTIGEYALVAAGSTIDDDVKDGDMAIARLYQQNKKGYGYKYNQEG